MKMLIMSDTHTRHDIDIANIEHDILIHCGDFSEHISEKILLKFLNWIDLSKATHKIIVPGNHDVIFYHSYSVASLICEEHNAILLNDKFVSINKINFYGSPWTPRFGSWPFMDEDSNLKNVWDKIPKNTNVLITHGPPIGILDLNFNGKRCGSQSLLDAVLKINPKYHLFGHIHESNGLIKKGETTFVNASYYNKGRYYLLDY